MTKQDDGGPAFPVLWDVKTDNPLATEGMSLRDKFAGDALQGIAGRLVDVHISDVTDAASRANEVISVSLSQKTAKQAAVIAYRLADAMLKQRGKR
jgi:hypothetical protein